MTPKQVALVQDSFAKVALISEAAAVLFYDRLFDIAPQMKAMPAQSWYQDFTSDGRMTITEGSVLVNENVTEPTRRGPETVSSDLDDARPRCSAISGSTSSRR